MERLKEIADILTNKADRRGLIVHRQIAKILQLFRWCFENDKDVQEYVCMATSVDDYEDYNFLLERLENVVGINQGIRIVPPEYDPGGGQRVIHGIKSLGG